MFSHSLKKFNRSERIEKCRRLENVRVVESYCLAVRNQGSWPASVGNLKCIVAFGAIPSFLCYAVGEELLPVCMHAS